MALRSGDGLGIQRRRCTPRFAAVRGRRSTGSDATALRLDGTRAKERGRMCQCCAVEIDVGEDVRRDLLGEEHFLIPRHETTGEKGEIMDPPAGRARQAVEAERFSANR